MPDRVSEPPTRATSPHAGSACPGLLRVVPAADGGLCRIRLPGGALRADQARAVADAAEAFGNGIIETTCRSNLQLRGVNDAAALLARLLAVGLGPRFAGADDARNVMISPAAGRDPAQLADVRDSADALLDGWQRDVRLHRLSPKFSLLLDGGEALAAPDHPHDVWLAALPWPADPTDGPWFAIGLAGCPPIAGRHSPVVDTDGEARDATGHIRDRSHGSVRTSPPYDGSRVLGAVGQRRLPRFVLSLLHAFLTCADAHAREGRPLTRMHALLADDPAAADALIAAASAASGVTLRNDPALSAWQRHAPSRALHAGIRMQRQTGLAMVAVKPRLGRLAPADLRALAALCDHAVTGTGTSAAATRCSGTDHAASRAASDARHGAVASDAARLRITPWHGVMLVDVPAAAAIAVQGKLARLGMAVATADPYSRLGCCAGAPACARSLADVRADAARVARIMPSLPAGADVHLSGCDRQCAAGSPPAILLLARAAGRYTVVARETGSGGTLHTEELALDRLLERLAPIDHRAPTPTDLHEPNA
ncbi:hypothetical protein [Chitinasiproducens palmae]|uniref:Precorrin-3B synthase n=1 Tax=Chitinasiproducens palmae TaxID=1770053 RepID=A0A1H2PRZ7_9BURK|nr:hypothetical protein [Chitinasiproducens palmae]SDV49706.1 precorrin-3B synthase [Chitinasiproducens palmae]